MGFYAFKEKWIDYADVVGDKNPVHRDEEFARRVRFGPKNEGKLEGIIAPGMWIFSHLGGRFNHAEVVFKNVVYNGTELQIEETGENFSILSLNGTVVDGKLAWKECAKRDLPDRKMDYVFPFDLTKDRIRSFLNSAGIISNGDVRNFMLMSLSAPALLDYGERNGVVGLHLKQTYEQHDSVKLGPLEVGICAGKSRPGIAIFENYWIQNGRLVASGKSMVGPATIYPEEIKFAA